MIPKNLIESFEFSKLDIARLAVGRDIVKADKDGKQYFVTVKPEYKDLKVLELNHLTIKSRI